jgi:indolepyruvate ferredoxin oxidoreductase beta subunit
METKKILFTGVGGQGTLLASRLLGPAAMEAGIPVRVSEVHGMAQRGGVVESTVMLGGLKSPIISEGEADILVSFEPLEALRALSRCSSGSTIITNTVPIVPFTVDLGQAEYPDMDYWLEFMKKNFARVCALDAETLAKEAGTTRAVNVVLLGTLISLGEVPVSREMMEQTIRQNVKPKFVDANLKALELGFSSAEC